MTSDDIKRIIELVKENNQRNNVEIVASLLGLGIKLERLETLENENIELQLQIEQLEDSAKIKAKQVDEYVTTLKEKYVDLKQENEKLKNENQILNQSVQDTYDTSQEIIAELKEELQIANDNNKTQKWFNDNQFNLLIKYQKAIEILASCLDYYEGEGIGYFECVFENPIITFDLNNKKELEQCEQLKEVLGYE